MWHKVGQIYPNSVVFFTYRHVVDNLPNAIPIKLFQGNQIINSVCRYVYWTIHIKFLVDTASHLLSSLFWPFAINFLIVFYHIPAKCLAYGRFYQPIPNTRLSSLGIWYVDRSTICQKYFFFKFHLPYATKNKSTICRLPSVAVPH